MIKKATISLLRMLILYLIFAIFIISSIPSQSAAMFITPGTGGVISVTSSATSSNSLADIAKIKTFLESKIVKQRLADFGLTGEEISDRLNQLSPAQLHHVATHIDQVGFGGDNGLGVLITLLVIVILVIVIMKLMNKQVIIK